MTNQKQIKAMQEKLDNLYTHLTEEVGSSIMDLVNRIVELELLLDKECGQ